MQLTIIQLYLIIFLGGSQDNGSHKFTDAGIGPITSPLGGDGAFCHIDQTDGQIQIVSVTGNNYRYSRNGGATFAVVAGGGSATGRFINPTDYDDALDVMYTAHNANNYGLVLDLGTTTTPVLNTISLASTLAGRQISAIKVDPNSPGGVVWMATGVSQEGTSFGTTVPIIFRLSAANTLVPTVDRTVSLPLPAGTYVSSIDVQKGNADHILVTCSNYGVPNSVMESVDGGFTWTNLEGNLPDMPIRWGLFAPANAQLNGPTGGNGGIILATQLGVWTTSSIAGGSTVWTPNNTNFVNTRIDMIKYRESDNLLVAGTHGRGLYTATIPTVVTSVNPVLNTKGFIQYISATKQQLFIKTGNLNGVKNITIHLLDASGRTVLTNRTAYASTFLNVGNLASGMYLVKIYGDKKEMYTQQFVK